MSISRSHAAELARETLAILDTGQYRGVFGNDSREIAELFRDRSPDQPTLDVFQRVFQELVASPR